ncbi:hypothetical protein SODALDRAFT_338391 [Sodiomyces alkalinus F11]|uniref:VASt domain-containing protein n=1 Tax=Sodiomyces alkalinus (strain CBS 110278 / VKM F-3762 / F11) TaxID=1314773 RepID=A0A3N2Q270_SODAK|nr:hypothetical protein SODALDRAFT_338391 [Sodiomyces alkalinus F11]ROT40725.1 hypothetical protein SODALDRAFT_338391 [Sodiomyces alkalinus F11]
MEDSSRGRTQTGRTEGGGSGSGVALDRLLLSPKTIIAKRRGRRRQKREAEGDRKGNGIGIGIGIDDEARDTAANDGDDLLKGLGLAMAYYRQKDAREEEGDEEEERGGGGGDKSEAEDGRDGSKTITMTTTEDRSHNQASSSSLSETLPATASTVVIPSPVIRPNAFAVSTHPSQIGYLTTSSPLGQEEHQAPELASPSSTIVANRPESVGSDSRSSSLSRDARRSPSPSLAGNSGSSPGTSPERRATSAVDGGVNLDAVGSGSGRSRDLDLDLDQNRNRNRDRDRDRNRDRDRDDYGHIDSATPSLSDTASSVSHITASTSALLSSRPSESQDSETSHASSAPSPWGTLVAHRRTRSNSASPGPSKLSNATFAPMSPTVESPPVNNPNSTSSFFSSMLSAAQTAANQITNTIQNTNLGPASPKNKAGMGARGSVPQLGGGRGGVHLGDSAATSHDASDKVPAVKTLGDGELTLHQLGIVEPSSPSLGPSPTRARSESAPVESTSGAPQPNGAAARLLQDSPAIERSPVPSVPDEKTSVSRSGSVRSSVIRHRPRGSSTATRATTTTIGPPIAATATGASAAQPASPSAQQRLSGFAVSSKKRNRDFHVLFKSVPDDDYLIEDYSCALQREILAHGRLNILGWSTTLVMSFDEIVAVEKRSTALVFKNGLMVTTLHARHIFASFASRDSTYDLIINIWKLGHPSLRSTLNGVELETTGGDKTEKIMDAGEAQGPVEPEDRSASVSELDDDSEDGSDMYDEDDEGEPADTAHGSEVSGTSDSDKAAAARKVSGAVVTNGAPPDSGSGGEAGPPAAGDDFPGPATHPATDCGDAASHLEKVVGDDVVPAPLGKVHDLMFGAGSVNFMLKWLKNEAKCWDIVMEDKKGLSAENKTRAYNYMKPLPGSIGPSKTKCIVAETVDSLDFEKAVHVSVVTQTPDVPSGNAFTVKTKYCLSWAENNSTRIHVSCVVDWTAKSWLKGAIEKGANDGQVSYCTDLVASLKAAVSSKSRPGADASRGVAGKKRKGRKGRSLQASTDTDTEKGDVKPKKQDWGLFEPLRPLLGPAVDLIKPIMTGNIMYGLLVGLLVTAWFGFGFPDASRRSRDVGYYAAPDRIAAYEEIWRREESELWDWLQERVNLERIREGAAAAAGPSTVGQMAGSRAMRERLGQERLDDREMETAIRTTEERLQGLKELMGKNKGV